MGVVDLILQPLVALFLAPEPRIATLLLVQSLPARLSLVQLRLDIRLLLLLLVVLGENMA